MSVGAVGGTSGDTMQLGPALQRAQLSREEFLGLLIAEITQQNPLEPLDNGQFLSQLVNLQNLETTAALEDGISSLGQSFRLTTASGLIGKQVSGTLDDGSETNGRVERVTMEQGSVRLWVDGNAISLDSVSEILE